MANLGGGGALPTLQHLSGQTKASWAKENHGRMLLLSLKLDERPPPPRPPTHTVYLMI